MARPKGLRLNPDALDLYRRAHDVNLTEAAALLGMSLPTLSNLISGVSGASVKTVQQIEDRIGQAQTGALFPERHGRFVAVPQERGEVAA